MAQAPNQLPQPNGDDNQANQYAVQQQQQQWQQLQMNNNPQFQQQYYGQSQFPPGQYQQQQYPQQQMYAQFPGHPQQPQFPQQPFQPQQPQLPGQFVNPQQQFQNQFTVPYQPIPSFSIQPTQNQQNQIAKLNIELEKYRKKEKELEQQMEDLENKLKSEKRKYQEISKIQDEQVTEIENLKYDNTALNEKFQKTLKQLKECKTQCESLELQINQLKVQLEEKDDQYSQELRKLRSRNAEGNQGNQNFLQQQLSNQDQEIEKLKKDLQNANNKYNQSQKQLEEQKFTQNDIDDLNKQIDQEKVYYERQKEEVIKWQNNHNQLKKQLEQKQKELESAHEAILKIRYDLKRSETKVQDLNQNLEIVTNQANDFKTKFQELLQLYKDPKRDLGKVNAFDEEMKQIERRAQGQQERAKLEEQKKAEEIQRQFEQQNIRKLEMKDFQQKKMEKQKLEMQQRAEQAKKESGFVDVCYIVDSTKSMEPYIQQTRDCIKQSQQLIKHLTNREVNWSAIGYYDVDIKAKQLKGKDYPQFDFSRSAEDLIKFIDKIEIRGGYDQPEDIKGAFEQMTQKLKWTSKFKIVILITDAPCHGSKYHNLKPDQLPNDDITDTIKKLIDMNTILIGLNFKAHTSQMFQVFKDIFDEAKKSEQLSFVDMNSLSVDKIAQQMAKCIGEASQNATQINKHQTKSKAGQQQRPEGKDGAMEALCKQGNFYDFETQADVKVIETKFQVLKVEIKQEIFDANVQTIDRIGSTLNDYNIRKEGEWDCIRTEKPFAFGMMKDVFLMKKKNNKDELYVIKTPIGSQPYQDLDSAVRECRSHLVCQQLMKRFRKDIDEKLEENKKQNNYPKVIYSDFLILEERKDRYWIGERFFKGEFVKYNNNYGYINGEMSELNKFAQAFSYYTFFISDGEYLINDVQGVSIYFTDPAINTKKGNYDDTDMGLDGQEMFIISFEMRNQLAYEILSLLNIMEDSGPSQIQQLKQNN